VSKVETTRLILFCRQKRQPRADVTQMDRNVSDIEEIIRKLLLWFITMIEVGATNEIIIT